MYYSIMYLIIDWPKQAGTWSPTMTNSIYDFFNYLKYLLSFIETIIV